MGHSCKAVFVFLTNKYFDDRQSLYQLCWLTNTHQCMANCLIVTYCHLVKLKSNTDTFCFSEKEKKLNRDKE